MKKILLLVVTLTFILSLLSFADASTDVNITLPTFNVTLNGTKINNSYRQYPLIIYNDITYFPMTYHDCRYLSLSTTWSNNAGLGIYKQNTICGFKNDTTNIKNKTSYKATIPSFNIKINGNNIDNKSEKYPLLLFRDVTYFPMTWRFCVTEFGWNYNFSLKDGLTISSSDKKVSSIYNTTRLNIKDLENTIITDDAIYYLDKDSMVKSAPINSLGVTKNIFQIPINQETNLRADSTLYMDNNSIYLKYHLGGGFMGNDYYNKINQNDTVTEVAKGYVLYKDYGDYAIKVDQWAGGSFGNMTIKHGDNDFIPLGEPNYWYSCLCDSSSLKSSSSLYVKDNYIYTTAGLKEETTNNSAFGMSETRICKINMETNETEFISKNSTTKNFILDGDYIYYFDINNKLYQLNINTYEEIWVDISSDNENIQVSNETVYYPGTISGYPQCNYPNRLFTFNPTTKNCGYIYSNGRVLSLDKVDDYIVCKIKEDFLSGYRFIVIDSTGNEVVNLCDNVSSYNIINNTLYYLEAGNKMIYSVKLK